MHRWLILDLGLQAVSIAAWLDLIRQKDWNRNLAEEVARVVFHLLENVFGALQRSAGWGEVDSIGLALVQVELLGAEEGIVGKNAR